MQFSNKIQYHHLSSEADLYELPSIFVFPEFDYSGQNDVFNQLRRPFAFDRSFYNDFFLRISQPLDDMTEISDLIVTLDRPGCVFINYLGLNIQLTRNKFDYNYDWSSLQSVFRYAEEKCGYSSNDNLFLDLMSEVTNIDPTILILETFPEYNENQNLRHFDQMVNVPDDIVDQECCVQYKRVKVVKPKDDESWFIPTYVKILDGNARVINRKCHRIKKMIGNLSCNLILHPLSERLLERHIDNSNCVNCPIKDVFIKTLNDNTKSSTYSKPIVGQWFGWGETADALKKTSGDVSGVCGKFEELFSKMKTSVNSVDVNVKHMAWGMFKNIMYFALNPSWKTAAFAIAMSLIDIGICNYNIYESFMGPLSTLFQSVEKKQERSSTVVGQTSDEDREWASSWNMVISTLVSVILGAFSLKDIMGKEKDELMKGLFITARNLTFLNVFFKQVLENILLAIKKIWNWCLQKIYGRSTFSEELIKEPEEIKLWASSILYLTDPALESRVLASQSLCNLVVERHVQSKLMVSYLLAEKSNAKIFNVIKDLIGKIEKLYNKLVSQHLFSPARYEPYVIWVHGTPNIGKSYLVQDLVTKLLTKYHQLTSPNVIYTRNPGVDYWNMLNGEPCVWYDDFLCVSGDMSNRNIAEYFALKSCSPFNPNMAAIEDKNSLYNPYIVIITSNSGFPTPTGVMDTDAFYRRRDFLVEASKVSNHAKTNTANIDEKILDKFEHLEFKRWTHCDRSTGWGPGSGSYENAETYQQLITNLEDSYGKYYERESKNYAKRLRISKNVLESITHNSDFKNSTEVFLSKLKEIGRDEEKSKGMKQLHECITAGKYSSFMPVIGQGDDLPEDKKNKDLLTGEEDKSPSFFRKVKKHKSNILPTAMSECVPREIFSGEYKVPKINKRIKLDDNPFEWEGFYTPDIDPSEYYCAGPMVDPKSYKCLHDFFSKMSLKDKMLYHYIEFFDKDGIAAFVYKNESNVLGGIFGDNVYYFDKLYESVYVIPLGNCSSANCTYDSETFKGYAKLVLLHQAINNKPNFVDSRHFDYIEAFKQYHKKAPITKMLDVFRNKCSEQYQIVDDDGKIYVYSKEADITKVSFFRCLCTIGKWVLVVVSLVVPMVIGYKYIKNRNTEVIIQNHELEPNLTPSGDLHTQKLLQTNRSQLKTLDSPLIVGQMIDKQYLDAEISRIERNTFFIMAYKDDEDTTPVVARCLGLGKSFALGVTHYFERYNYFKNFKYKLAVRSTYTYTFFDIEYEELEVNPIKDSGLSLFIVPARIPKFKSIFEMFYDREHTIDINRECELVEIHLGYEKNKIFRHKLSVDLVQNKNVQDSNICKGWNIVKGLSYKYGGKGVCGSILISLMKRPKIIGMHTSGSLDTSFGIAEFINQNDLRSIICDYDRIYPQMDHPDNAKFQLEGCIHAIGSIPNPPRLSEQSRIIPSMLHGLFPVMSTPAPLSIRDSRVNFPFSPLKYGCEKQTLNTKAFDVKSVNISVNHLFDRLHTFVKPVRNLTDMTYLESINGFPISGYEGMEMDTSEGYPWLTNRPKNEKNKRYLFEFENDKVISINDELVKVMNQKGNLRNNNVVPITIYMDCLKDSRILKSKLNEPGKTRVFNIQPVDFTIQVRQYFLDYDVAYSKARLKAENTIGINVNGHEWTQLHDYLNNFSNNILAGDFKSFGTILDTAILYAIGHQQNLWYKKNIPDSIYHTCREIAQTELNHAFHLSFDLVYEVVIGQASGSSPTIYQNSRTLSCKIRIAFIKITKLPITSFDRYIKLVSNGDDCLIAVADEIIPIFNNISLHNFFLEYNIVYTDAKKEGVIIPCSGIYECTYLKSQFLRHPEFSNEFLAKLDIISIQECLQWIWKCEDRLEASKVNSVAAVRLSYGHGPEYYNFLRRKVLDFWEERDELVIIPSWLEENERIWFGNTSIYPQMDDAHGVEKVSVDKKETTVLETHRGYSEGAMAIVDNPTYDQLSVGGCAAEKENECYSKLCDRWLVVDTIEWKISHEPNTLIKGFVLPKEAVENNRSVPNIMPFRIHRYWRGDMEIKVLVNSNKFQIGQLQVSWYYADYEDKFYNQHRQDIYNASQRIHGLVNAGSSNEVCLYIPYRHYLSNLYTSVVGEYVTSALTLGRLVIMPINQLNITPNQTPKVHCQVLVRFPNSCFSATVDSSLGINVDDYLVEQMDVMHMAMKGLNCLMSDNNRDQPPNLRSPNYVVPTVSHSFATGRGDVEQLQSLRLDPRGQTPHPMLGEDEMTIRHVVSKFALLKKITWSADHYAKKKIWSLEMAPLLNKDQYSYKLINNNTFRYIPPIGVLSSLYCYWRGDIELRFDVVASSFHSGKLLVAFVPGLQEDDFDMLKAQGSPYQVFDIKESTSFLFKAPYIACRPWWPVKYSSADGSIIRERLGTILMYVFNPLIPMPNVPNFVEINVYQRAAPNFELSIPSTPKLGSANYPVIKYPDTSIAKTTTSPVFTTFSKTYLDALHLTVYHANTSGAIALWANLKDNTVYTKSAKIKIGETPFNHYLEFYNTTTEVGYIQHAVKAKNQSYPVVYVFSDLYKAQQYVLTGDSKNLLTYVQGGKYEYYVNATKEKVQVPSNAFVEWHVVEKVKKKKIYAQIGETTNVEAPITSLLPPVASSNFGMFTFGETSSDLKDLCRRYSRYYTDFQIKTLTSFNNSYSLAIPIMTQRGELLITSWSSSDNLLREGHTSLISSGYRFSRGGLRFRMVFYGVNEGEQVFIQFKPDAPCYTDVPFINNLANPSSFADYLDPSYPVVFQGFVISNCIEFEIPWYMTGDYNLLQRINFPLNLKSKHKIVTEFASLGTIFMHLHAFVSTQKRDKIRVDMFYSLADDCRFSTFVGFPPMMFLNDVNK